MLSPALYFQLLRDCFEAVVLAAFFFLLLAYLSTPPPDTTARAEDDDKSVPTIPRPLHTRAERQEQLYLVTHDMHLKKWVWPLGRLKWRCAGGGDGEGQAFLWLMRISVGQYVIVRPLSTLIAVVGYSLPADYYCLASWSPRFLHLWTASAITISVTIAMYAILQLYLAFEKELAPYSPVLQLVAVKICVFLTFWQESGLTVLASFDVIKPTEHWTAESIVVGIAAILSTFEMACIAFLHVKAFSYLPYRALAPPPPCDDNVKRKLDGQVAPQRTKKWPALKKCLILSDLGRELKEETGYVARRGRMTEEEKLIAQARSRSAVKEDIQGDDVTHNKPSVKPEEVSENSIPLLLSRQGGSCLRGQRIGSDGCVLPKDTEALPTDESMSLLEENASASDTARPRWEAEAARREAERPENWWKRSLGRAFGAHSLSTPTNTLSTAYSRLGDGYHPPPPPSEVDRRFGRAPSSVLTAPPLEQKNLGQHVLDDMPRLGDNSILLIPAAHALGPPARLPTLTHQYPEIRARPISEALPLSPAAFSNLMGLGREVFRPPPALTELPPTRGSWRRASVPTTDSRNVDDTQSLQSLKVFASEQSKSSQGLPPGAAPPVTF